MKNKTHYSTIIVGATAFGLGYATRDVNDTLVLEKTSLIGSEFIDSLHMQSGDWVPTSIFGKSLKKECIERNILSNNGRIRTPALASLLFQYVQQNSIQVLFLTEIINIEKKEQGYVLTIYNNSGFQTITADLVIDTTSNAQISPDMEVYIVSKSINAILHSEGHFENETILRYPLEIIDDWITARHKLHMYWQNRPQKMKDLTLSYIPFTFDYQVAEPGPYFVKPDMYWIPSNSYCNLLEAFETGLEGGGLK